MKKSPNPYTFIQVKRLSYDPIHRMNFYSSGITHKREKHPHFSFKLQKYKKIEYYENKMSIYVDGKIPNSRYHIYRFLQPDCIIP